MSPLILPNSHPTVKRESGRAKSPEAARSAHHLSVTSSDYEEMEVILANIGSERPRVHRASMR